MKKFFNTEIFIVLILFLLALLVRTFLLDRVPIGIGNDELDFVINAKSVFYQFSDVSQKWNPLSLVSVPQESARGPMPYLLIAPIVGILNFNLFNAKLPYAVFGSFFVVILYLISKKLFNPSIAFWTSAVAIFNPWLIFISRTAFEAPVALYFYFLGILVLLYGRSWTILFSLLFFFIGFYSYIGTNLIFLPVCIVTCWYSWRFIQNKKFGKYYSIVVAISTILVIYYGISIQNGNIKNRIGELGTPNSSYFENKVNEERKLSLENPLNPFFSNKYNIFANYFIKNYLNSISSQLLFTNGETHGLYTLYKHGFFYITDLVLIFAGLFLVIKKFKRTGLLLLAISLFSPIPTALSILDTSYIFRSSLLFPVIIILAGVGLQTTIELSKKFKFVLIFLVFTYIWQFSNFAHIYLIQNPIYNSQQSFFSSRILSRILIEENKFGNPIIVVAQEPRLVYKQFIFYNNLYSRSTKDYFAKKFLNEDYTYGNISIAHCDEVKNFPKNATYIIHHIVSCDFAKSLNSEHIDIPQLVDSGAVYKIYNSNICKKNSLERFVHSLKLEDLDIETMSIGEFCSKFITSENELYKQ